MEDISINQNQSYKNDNYKIAVLGDSLLIKGAKLIGIKEVYKDDEHIEEHINDLFNNKSIGIVIINESIVAKIKNNKLVRAMESSLKPIFIEVPSYNEPELYIDMLKRLIIRAIGIDITNK
ncbi:MAG: V-type ATP synthase subunit F [Candidatus Micrarchaeia archaeon]